MGFTRADFFWFRFVSGQAGFIIAAWCGITGFGVRRTEGSFINERKLCTTI